MSAEHDINVVKAVSMLPMSEEERQELLARITKKLADLDECQGDSRAHIAEDSDPNR